MEAKDLTSSSYLFLDLQERIASRIGLNFPREKWGDLERAVAEIAKAHGFRTEEACIEWLLSPRISTSQFNSISKYLTVGETYFFRNPVDFEILETRILPEWKQTHPEKELRIWSAGCSTGEEAYSIAISVDRCLPDLSPSNLLILATDINLTSIEKANVGIYRDWSFRGIPIGVKPKYFMMRDEGSYEIIPEVRSKVTFSYLNLVEDVYPALLNHTSAMDIIFCRNVLMYFLPSKAESILNRFYHSLRNGGWLILGPVDTLLLGNSDLLRSKLELVEFPGVNIYKKKDPLKAAEITPRIDSKEQQTFLPRPAVVRARLLQQDNRKESLYTQAFGYFQDGRYPEVIELLMASHSERIISSSEAVLISKSYANEGKLGEALRWSKRAIESDRFNAALYYLHATILQEEKKVEEAVSFLKQALFLDADFVLAHFVLGNLYLREGRILQGRKSFENARMILRKLDDEDVLPASDGLSVKQLREILEAVEILK